MPTKTAKPKLAELPNKLSDLFEAALNDFKKTLRSPKFEVDMGSWVSPWYVSDSRGEEVMESCRVCVAGAMMVKTLDANARRSFDPSDYPTRTRNKLHAINYLRSGEISLAFEVARKRMPPQLKKDRRLSSDSRGYYVIFMARYNEVDSRPFFDDCHRLIKLLREYDC